MLAVPLRIAPLVTMAVLSSTLALSLYLAPFGLPLALILFSWFFKYSYTYLDLLISGASEPPVLSVEMILKSHGEWRTLLPLVIVTIAFFLSGAAEMLLGIALTILLAIPLLIALPSVLAIQGWTGSIKQSLRPKLCLRMANLLGADYPQVVSASMVVVAAVGTAQLFSARIPLVLRLALHIYAWLAIFGMTGKAIFRHRTEIELDTQFAIPVDPDKSEKRLAQERQAWLDAVYAEARGGAVQSAWQTVMRRLDHASDPVEELRWAYLRASHWHFKELTNRIAAEFVGRLLDRQLRTEAVQVARERLSTDSKFHLRRATDALQLAMFAGSHGDRETALGLLTYFDDHYPNDELREKAQRLKLTMQYGAQRR